MNIDKSIKKIIDKLRKKRSSRGNNQNEINYNTLKNLIKENSNITIVDVRSPQEYKEEKIRGAINIPLYELSKTAQSILTNKEELIVLYCACGIRSLKAYEILKTMGYTNLYTLKGRNREYFLKKLYILQLLWTFDKKYYKIIFIKTLYRNKIKYSTS